MLRPLFVLSALAVFAAAGHDVPRPRLIDFNPWAWLPTNRNRSPSIMDYFFPPSRTPKQSILDPPADRQPPKTTVAVDTAPTTLEEKSTRRHTTKSKITIPIPYQTATSKPKKTTNKSTSHTVAQKYAQKAKITAATNGANVAASTHRPTKHYTIRPSTESTATQTVQNAESTNTEDDSTENSETETQRTTVEEAKETASVANIVNEYRTDAATASTATVESTTLTETTFEDPADSREGYLPLRDKPQQNHVKINEQTKKETVPLPAGSTSVLAKPTKYHYYPHNQHIYLLPECAIQQVCNAVYVRLNYTQPLCACPARYRDPCSASLNADDLHTTRLTTDSKKKYASKAVTLVKTCEAVSEMRECRPPRDWALLALQNIRTGKSHYLVICRCPEGHILEGPMSHDQPTYASVPGIRVYGMMCVRPTPAFHTGYNSNRYNAGSVASSTSAYKVEYSQAQFTEKPAYNRYPYHSYLTPNYYNRRSRAMRARRMALDNSIPWYKVRELAISLQ